jgi:hypothetical protein
MMLFRSAMLAALVASCAFCQPCLAQASPSIDAAARAKLIDALIVQLNDYYIYPDVARQIELKLRANQQRGAYDAYVRPGDLASALTADTRGVSHDLHLRVMYSEDEKSLPAGKRGPSKEARMREQLKAANYGIGKVDKLPGNIGYLQMFGLVSANYAAKAVSAAMAKLADSDALIIDMRNNGGGDPTGVAFLSSYLFDQRTHLNDLYWREGKRTVEYWTDPKVPGTKYGQRKDVYVLTGARTFSAAEEFSYNLKQLKRATLVGETTGGGANPGGMRRLGNNFMAFVPSGRAINPITKTSWEGTGVAADVVVPARDALIVAQKLALAKLVVVAGPAQAQLLRARVAELEQQGGFTASAFASQPIYLRGSMNNWGTTHPMRQATPTTFSADLVLAPGRHEFKVGSADFNVIDYGAARGKESVRRGENTSMTEGGENLALELDQAGTYTFMMDVKEPHKPLISVFRKP